MSNRFRKRQVVSDLLAHVKPLLARHLASFADAWGLGLRETGQAFAKLRDNWFRFEHEETSRLLSGLKGIVTAKGDGFQLAVVILLTDTLQRNQASDLPVEVWQEVSVDLRSWPASLRAAVANGIALATERQLVTLNGTISRLDRVTRSTEEICAELLRIVRSMRVDELQRVAEASTNDDIEKMVAKLREVISQHDGIFPFELDECWDLDQAVEAVSFEPGTPGHVGCTALTLLNVLSNEFGDRSLWLNGNWPRQSEVYTALPPSQRDPIIAAIRYIYEVAASTAFKLNHKEATEVSTIPVVDDL